MKPIKPVIFLTLVLLLSYLTIFSQISSPGWGQFSSEEIQLRVCAFDPEAEALKLLDEGVTVYDIYNKRITSRRTRIKILKPTGIDRANIIIPFYSKDDYETVENIEANTYNFDAGGNAIVERLDKKLIFKEKRNEYYSVMKFPMPAVNEGSIIEFKYEIRTKGFSTPDDWKFQDDIPTVKSTYLVDITARAELTYHVQTSKDLRVIEKRNEKDGEVYFEMNNVPALRREPFMDAEKDYVQRVKFQLSGVNSVFGARVEVNKTWKALAYDLMTDRNFGAHLDKDLNLDDLKKLLKSEKSETKKLRVIYDYVVKNFSWNKYYGIYAANGLKEVTDKKKGTAGELNLLLVNLLYTNGIDAYPLLAAERSFGKVNPDFPFVDQFNKVIAFAIADGKQYILDATQKNCPAGLTPYQYLNTMAFLVDKKKNNLVTITSPQNNYRNKINIEAAMDKDGVVKGTASIESFLYSRMERLNELENGQKSFITDHFENISANLILDSFQIIKPEFDSLPLMQNISFTQQSERTGDMLIVNTNIFTGLQKNPFISSKRFTDINFGYPHYLILEAKVKLPPGIRVEAPENISLISPERDIQLFRQITKEHDVLRISVMFLQKTTLIPAESYNSIKSFYKEMVDKLNQPVIIKTDN